MSDGADPAGLSTCGCQGDSPSAPAEVWNRSGLDRIAYRIGDQAAFRTALIDRLSSADYPALASLTTRDPADPTIGLLDAWACIADVITFHQERIATESYLGTATERRSLANLGRLVGYEPAPGLAASTWLAFTLETAVGAPASVGLPVGLKVQSMPKAGGQPQTFETIEAFEARPEWNAMRPILTQPHPAPSASLKSYTIKGADPSIQPGDRMLVVTGSGAGQQSLVIVNDTVVDPIAQTTRIDVASDPPPPPPLTIAPLPFATIALQPIRLSTDAIRSDILIRRWRQADLDAFARIQRWSVPQLTRAIRTVTAARSFSPQTGLFRFGVKAAIFGHNAPNWSTLSASQRLGDAFTDSKNITEHADPPYPTNWDAAPNNTLASTTDANVYLDTTYPRILSDGWVVLDSPSSRQTYRLAGVSDISTSGFTLSARVTRLTLSTNAGFGTLKRRETSVLAGSTQLALADLPLVDDVAGTSIVLDGAYLGLTVGRPIAVTGTCTDLAGVTTTEFATIADIVFQGGSTILQLADALQHSYARASVTINANIVQATHGETKTETLGSGSSVTPFQRFTLRQGPLSYVSSISAKGAASTLQLAVGGARWQEVDQLYGAGPNDRVYTVRQDDDGSATVLFGDGVTGARLPTGLENVAAQFRVGIGTAGLVDAGSLSLLATKPMGVRTVLNPLASDGAQDPEGPDAIRTSAPLHILTLGRVVSLQDYEDFARAFSGIVKAMAGWTWNGRARGIFLTVAGPDGLAIDPAGMVARNLVGTLRQIGSDPQRPIQVATYAPALFRIAGKLKLDPTLDAAAVSGAVEAALRARFGFDARAFGQSVALSEVMAAIHSVPGVIAFDADALFRLDQPSALNSALAARLPQAGSGAPLPAELLTLDPRPLDFGVLT